MLVFIRLRWTFIFISFFFLCVLSSSFLSFIMQLLSFGQADLDLDEGLLIKIYPQGNERVSLFLQLGLDFIYLFFLKQEFPVAHRLMVIDVAMRIFRYV